jgi:hypothetical protein
MTRGMALLREFRLCEVTKSFCRHHWGVIYV